MPDTPNADDPAAETAAPRVQLVTQPVDPSVQHRAVGPALNVQAVPDMMVVGNPVPIVYVPGPHCAHAVTPGLDELVPAGHGVHGVLPVPENCPAGHSCAATGITWCNTNQIAAHNMMLERDLR